jgi:heptosyltransferase I
MIHTINQKEKYKLPVILTGTKEEESKSLEVMRLSKMKKNILISNGIFKINEVGALISKSELIVAPDTGVVHIAASLNVPIVDLVSRESPSMWHPWTSKKNYRVLFHPQGSLYERNNKYPK